MAEVALDLETSRQLVERAVFMLKALHEAGKVRKRGYESTSWSSQLRGFFCALEIVVGYEAMNTILALVREEARKNLGESLTDELMERAFPQVEQTEIEKLGYMYLVHGRYDTALTEGLMDLKKNPMSARRYVFLINCYILLNRFSEAQALVEEADLKNVDSPSLHLCSYQLAFLNRDSAGMEKEVSWAMGIPGVEGTMLSLEAKTQAFFGRLGAARDFSQRAIKSVEQLGDRELVASHHVDVALTEALFGNTIEARQSAESALGLCNYRNIKYRVALALALAGDVANSKSLFDDSHDGSKEILVHFNYLPTLNALLALSRNDAFEAIEALTTATPYELGNLGKTALYPIGVRGEAFLVAHQGKEAAAEFQKILGRPGFALSGPIGIRGRVGLARAYAMQGDTVKARAAYQDFLTLWKDADSDIPILKQAKAEFANLK